MNRRGFLKSLATAVVGLAIAPSPTLLFQEFIPAGPVGEFVCYYMWQGELLVSNSSQCFIIEDISA